MVSPAALAVQRPGQADIPMISSHYTEDGQVDCNGSDAGVATSSDSAVLWPVSQTSSSLKKTSTSNMLNGDINSYSFDNFTNFLNEIFKEGKVVN